jgi:hypothetical protein
MLKHAALERQSGARVRLDLDDFRELPSLQVELVLEVSSSGASGSRGRSW